MAGKGFINLAWDKFQTNLPQAFHKVRLSEDFCDVTLACDDQGIVKAHKIILASGSLFFQKLLSTGRLGPNPHPLLYLRGVSAGQLESILDFLYSGEARVGQGELQSFLDLAQELEISGLIEDPDLLNKHQTIHQMSNAVNNKTYTNIAGTPKEKIENNQQERDHAKHVEYMSVKSENSEESVPWNNPSVVSEGVKCNYCQKTVKTSNYLQKHILRRHRQEPQEKLPLENNYEKEFNSDMRKNRDILSQDDKNTELENFSDENYLEEPIAEAAVDIKYENQKNCKEKKEPVDPLADDFSKDMIEHGEGTFSCKVCNFVTSNTPDMYMHIDIHIQAMTKKNSSKVLLRLPCEQCQIKFSSLSSLNAHKKRTHGLLISDDELKSDTNIRKPTSPLWNFATKGLGFATCMFCKKNIPSKGGSTTSAMGHIKSKHPEEIKKYNNKIEKQYYSY